ncbi:hypothetical protein KBP30_23515 [Streptomyces sp. Go40/10]|uniref:hypothetical protein n=1 Tax=Streptomyces sp. Go40/10 TaxID=2825844 RepID=UPI001E479833|nr:hypothetical protein [Streptomyces sp. Go40/10]UFR03957.1 hypothetical protein KBP30_23515 [Streptomyces sp. Go40/10]
MNGFTQLSGWDSYNLYTRFLRLMLLMLIHRNLLRHFRAFHGRSALANALDERKVATRQVCADNALLSNKYSI